MQLAKIGARGRTTIPKTIQAAADLREGDEIAFEVEGRRLVIQEVIAERDECVHGLSKWGRRPIHTNTIKGYFRLAGGA